MKLPVCPIEALACASGGEAVAVQCPNNRADVKVNGFVTYNQIRGIPQGEFLSALLEVGCFLNHELQYRRTVYYTV